MNNSLGLVCYYGLFLYQTIESIIQHGMIDKFTRNILTLFILIQCIEIYFIIWANLLWIFTTFKCVNNMEDKKPQNNWNEITV